MYRRVKTIAAIIGVAAILLGMLSGCCTKRDVDAINGRLAELESQTREARDLARRMDSLVTRSTESNRELQNDVRLSTDQLAQQLAQILENYNDLMTRLDQISSQQVIRLSPTSSPGAQTEERTGPSEQPPPSRQPAIDCIETYDNAFTQVRRGEYEPAIEGFRQFLAECSTHDDVQNAYYWIGECYYAQEKYTEAVTEYEHLLNTYPNSPNLGRAIYKLARCKQELGKTQEAKQLYQRLVDEYAGTLEAEQATERLKDL